MVIFCSIVSERKNLRQQILDNSDEHQMMAKVLIERKIGKQKAFRKFKGEGKIRPIL